MKPPKNKKYFDILTVKDLISILSELPPNYCVFTEEEGIMRNLIWDNIVIDDEEKIIYLG